MLVGSELSPQLMCVVDIYERSPLKDRDASDPQKWPSCPLDAKPPSGPLCMLIVCAENVYHGSPVQVFDAWRLLPY